MPQRPKSLRRRPSQLSMSVDVVEHLQSYRVVYSNGPFEGSVRGIQIKVETLFV